MTKSKKAKYRCTDASPVANSETVKVQNDQIVYRRLQPDVPGLVRGVVFRPAGVTYLVKFADAFSEEECYTLDILTEKEFSSR